MINIEGNIGTSMAVQWLRLALTNGSAVVKTCIPVLEALVPSLVRQLKFPHAEMWAKKKKKNYCRTK